MIFVTKAYPKLAFYTPSRPEPFRFDRGIFDTDAESSNEAERRDLEKTLIKLSENPGVTGVQILEDSKNPNRCEDCGAAFKTQAALYGHLGSHKTAKQISEEALREGGTVPGNVTV